jgi:LmbE family N-acetylglucosaminyl deacetylase
LGGLTVTFFIFGVSKMNESVLIVAAHPDDEVLGCGGTIAKLVDSGALVHVVFLADGVFSRDGESQSEELNARRAAANKACDILGVTTVSFGDLPDNRMDSVALLDITQKIERHIFERRPSTLITHHAGDVNIDHRRTLEAVITACRPQFHHPVKSILSFEVPSSTEWQLPCNAPAFVPNWFVDISATLERKMAALDAYEFELRDWPHPRSRRGVEYLARWRGATVGVDAAEAFVLGRHVA